MDNLKRQWSKMEITSFALKWIGIVSMIVDHIGRMFFPDIWVFTAIGRLAFPIFAFLTAVGFMYTANIFRYGIRLFLLALLSEPIFDYAFFGTFFYPDRQNVFFTLTLAVWMLYLWISVNNLAVRWIAVILIMLISETLATDYNSMGLLMILIFYCFYNENMKQNILVAAVNILLMGRIQMFGALALIPISLYKGEQGRKMKWLFYSMYPLHFLCLIVIREAILR